MTLQVLVPHRLSMRRPDAGTLLERLEGRSMGCAWSVTYVRAARLVPAGNDTLGQEIRSALERVVAEMSTWEADSDISRFNRSPPGSWLPLPEAFAHVLACALRVAEASDGALDPTAGELITLWGFGPERRSAHADFALPGAAAIESARRRCGWQRLEVDAATGRMYQPGGMTLDLSAVAKGFAVDEVSRCLNRRGIEHHLVDVGGELRGSGMKPDGQPWWVDVQLPPGAGTVPATRIALHDLAVATSGDYIEGFDAGGQHYSHCIDPRAGRPIDNGVRSVTVLHTDCMEADAWSTALMVLGPAAGLALAESQQLAAQWLVRTGESVEETCTRGFRSLIT
jgi:thiamine biosynthesis lipoprotein